MKVQLYATLRQSAGGKVVELPLRDGVTVGELLRSLGDARPALRSHLWNEGGGLSDFVKVFVDGREIRHLEGLDTLVNGATTVDIFPPVAGG